MTKSIEDWKDDIVDVFIEYGMCEHNQDWDEFRTFDVAMYNVEVTGELRLMEILYEMKKEIAEDIYSRCMKIVEGKRP